MKVIIARSLSDNIRFVSKMVQAIYHERRYSGD